MTTLRDGTAGSALVGEVQLDAEALPEGTRNGHLPLVALGVPVALQHDQRLADNGEAEEIVRVVLQEGIVQAGGVGELGAEERPELQRRHEVEIVAVRGAKAPRVSLDEGGV